MCIENRSNDDRGKTHQLVQPTLDCNALTAKTGAGYKSKNEQGGEENDVSVAIDNIVASITVPPIICIE